MAFNNNEATRMKELGNDAYKSKDYNKAINFYTKAIQANPNDPSFYSNRALCYFNMENYEECIVECDRAINQSPEFIKAHKKKASALAYLFKFSEAVQAIKIAVNLDRGNQAMKNELEEYESYESNYNRYLDSQKNDNPSEALSCVTYLCNKLPQSKLLKMYRVEVLAKAGETDQATALLKNLSNRNDPYFMYLNGLIELYSGDSAKAKKYFAEGLQLDPNHAKCR